MNAHTGTFTGSSASHGRTLGLAARARPGALEALTAAPPGLAHGPARRTTARHYLAVRGYEQGAALRALLIVRTRATRRIAARALGDALERFDGQGDVLADVTAMSWTRRCVLLAQRNIRGAVGAQDAIQRRRTGPQVEANLERANARVTPARARGPARVQNRARVGEGVRASVPDVARCIASAARFDAAILTPTAGVEAGAASRSASSAARAGVAFDGLMILRWNSRYGTQFHALPTHWHWCEP